MSVFVEVKWKASAKNGDEKVTVPEPGTAQQVASAIRRWEEESENEGKVITYKGPPTRVN